MGIGSPLVHLRVVCSAFAIPELRMLSRQRFDSKRVFFSVGIIGDSQLEITECSAALSASYEPVRIGDAFSCSCIY